jgi:hypothetical protein
MFTLLWPWEMPYLDLGPRQTPLSSSEPHLNSPGSVMLLLASHSRVNSSLFIPTAFLFLALGNT